MQDAIPIEGQNVVENAVGIRNIDKIHHYIGDDDPQHQIWDAFVLVAETKPFKLIANLLQLRSLLYLIGYILTHLIGIVYKKYINFPNKIIASYTTA